MQQSEYRTCKTYLQVKLSVYYWPASWASIVLLAGVCRRRLLSVTQPTGGPGGRAADTARRASRVTSR